MAAQSLLRKSRTLKIRRTYYDYLIDRFRLPPPVPALILRGYWLNQAGFEIGQTVQVDVGRNRIVLTLRKA